MKDPERIRVAPGTITHDTIEQRLHVADNVQHKNRLLQHLCAESTVTKAIIFSATRRDADSLARDLNRQGYAAAALHGDMTQNARNRTMVNMHRGKIRLLVATDVAARGLDITGISHVINFDLPRSAEDYVNRIGRTGRNGESGVAISFASQGELAYLDRIERYIGKALTMHVIPGLEPNYPLHRLSSGHSGKSSNLAAFAAANAGPRNNGRSTRRSFSYKETGGASSYSGSGRRRAPKRDTDVTVEYRNGRSGEAGHAEGRRPGKKGFF
jgi:superfamily II DNA/RNA helicase